MHDTKQIRVLNDQLRKYGIGGKIMLTQGVQALGEEAILSIMIRMQAQKSFPEGDDPYQEHDFGCIKHDGKKLFWKIEYYDLQYQYHSPDAADPKLTNRVLTIMLAEEY